ncbi:transporter substrate-binding domain-containing protein [Microvirga massiliensis]|uniref:transporter substrate-binding domain-containing protein n=1 Tax=Microvirga massiliensis TaxID=1033741 RepID=UPI00062BA6A6|nr:transporter substrate-binding domain-containing protein [Microvirga massiliensis]
MSKVILGRACAVWVLGASLAISAVLPVRADLLEDIKQKGQITIGTEARFPPFEFVENGKIVGYAPDLLALIITKMPGVKVEQLDLPWQGILPGLAAKKFDFVVTSVGITKERADKYALTLPIAEATVGLLKRKNDTAINKPEDIVGKVVGSQAGSSQLKALRDYDEKLKRDTGKGVGQIKEYVDFNEAFADLAAGRIQAVAHSMSNLGPLVKQRGDVFAIVQPAFGPKNYFSWAGRKDPESASLVKFFNDNIAELNRSGKMKELQEKWFGFTMDVPADKVPDPTM